MMHVDDACHVYTGGTAVTGVAECEVTRRGE